MSWTSSNGMLSQVKLCFVPKEEAVACAEWNGIPCRVFEPRPRAMPKKPYPDNFKFGRIPANSVKRGMKQAATGRTGKPG